MSAPPPLPDPIKPPFKVRREVREYLHKEGVHLLCRIHFEPEIKGYDHRPQWLVGMVDRIEDPETGTVTYTRDYVDATTLSGTPIYSGRIKEVHR